MSNSNPEFNPSNEICIPVKVLKEWINTKLVAVVAEQMTLESITPATTLDAFRQGMTVATQESRLSTLNELDEYVSSWPHTNIDK